jgi:hypothetical protein
MYGNKASKFHSATSCVQTAVTLTVVYLAAATASAGRLIIPPPPSVQPGAIQSQTDATMFQESVSI